MSDIDVRPKRPRVRKRSTSIQLQIALDDAAKAMTADISAQKLVQQRIACLLKMQARERNDKLRTALATIKQSQAEIEKLKTELATALATKPAARPLDPVKIALANYEKEKNGGATCTGMI